MEAFKNLMQNLDKKQKIGILVFCQLVVIVIIVMVINFSFGERNHIETVNEGVLSSVPNSEKELYHDELWNIIKNNVDGLDKSIINDAVVRDGSYIETVDENNKNAKQVDFLVDIDSIKQTYKVTLAWSNNGNVTPVVDCPAYSDMKYKETFCKGAYRNTDSFSLYFPYYVYKDGNGEECGVGECNDDEASLIYMIEGDEEEKIITIESSICDVDKYNQEALEYIKDSTPFYDRPEYIVEYKVNNVDVVCD